MQRPALAALGGGEDRMCVTSCDAHASWMDEEERATEELKAASDWATRAPDKGAGAAAAAREEERTPDGGPALQIAVPMRPS